MSLRSRVSARTKRRRNKGSSTTPGTPVVLTRDGGAPTARNQLSLLPGRQAAFHGRVTGVSFSDGYPAKEFLVSVCDFEGLLIRKTDGQLIVKDTEKSFVVEEFADFDCTFNLDPAEGVMQIRGVFTDTEIERVDFFCTIRYLEKDYNASFGA